MKLKIGQMYVSKRHMYLYSGSEGSGSHAGDVVKGSNLQVIEVHADTQNRLWIRLQSGFQLGWTGWMLPDEVETFFDKLEEKEKTNVDEDANVG